jgi:hypothetical protein
MEHRHFVVRSITASAAALLAPATLAGTQAGVTLGPLSATAVPAMTPAMLVALGLLLAVIALRVLRQSGVAQRVLSVCLLGTASVLGALGVERSVATGAIGLSGGDCESATIEVRYQRDIEDDENAVENQCGRDLQILSYNFACFPDAPFDDNGSPVGTVVPDGEITPLGYCRDVEAP